MQAITWPVNTKTLSPKPMSAPPSPPSSSSSLSPRSPISPRSVPNPDGYFNPPRPENPRLESITEHVKADHGQCHRTSFAASISFTPKTSQATSLAGTIRSRLPSLIKNASPPPASKFQRHVSFDNFDGGDPTAKNTISFTLNTSHWGYQRKRRSRAFMVGVDENDYSDIALQWMLEELVDDGDHIICLRVVDKDSKIASDKNVERREYQKAADDLMKRIQAKNGEHRATNITLEFSVGKVSEVFGSMIAMYEPSMLVVGTRGRSLGGFQGLVSNRNSFSKWCLQHSPVPVVVVRPTEKRKKKKMKRDADPTRQDYARILKESGVEEHEIAGGAKSSSFEISNDLDTEAHAVAAALGLPARFDPTLKPFLWEESKTMQKVDSAKSDGSTTLTSLAPDARSVSPTEVLKIPKSPQLESPAISGDEVEESEDEDEEDGEFETVPGHILLGNQPEDAKKEKLHRMEQGEAGALLLGRKSSIGSADSSGSGGGGAPLDEDEDEEEDEEEEEKDHEKDERNVNMPTPS